MTNHNEKINATYEPPSQMSFSSRRFRRRFLTFVLMLVLNEKLSSHRYDFANETKTWQLLSSARGILISFSP